MYQIMVLLVILVDLDALLLGARFSLFFLTKTERVTNVQSFYTIPGSEGGRPIGFWPSQVDHRTVNIIVGRVLN
jgi:hypothetical protein